MLVSDGDEKLHLISCEATCVHEEGAKRIPNVRFTEGGAVANLHFYILCILRQLFHAYLTEALLVAIWL